MKKLYAVLSFAGLFASGMSFAQNFSYTPIMTKDVGAPGDELICDSRLVNATMNTIPMDVVRTKDVMADAPTWTSAFCMDVCYLPTTDSVGYTFYPGDTVDFTFHFYTDANPDSAGATMRWRNLNTPANTFTQVFIGVTKIGSGIGDLNQNLASVQINPNPIRPGDVFMVNISNVKENKPMRMVFYNLFGSEVASTLPMIEGFNLVSLDLPAGVYSYALVSDDAVMNTGKIILVQ